MSNDVSSCNAGPAAMKFGPLVQGIPLVLALATFSLLIASLGSYPLYQFTTLTLRVSVENW